MHNWSKQDLESTTYEEQLTEEQKAQATDSFPSLADSSLDGRPS